jgi:hypothetical protein
LVVENWNYLRELSSLGLAVEARAPGDFNQILIVGGAMNFSLRRAQFSLCVLHGDSSRRTCAGDRVERIAG